MGDQFYLYLLKIRCSTLLKKRKKPTLHMGSLTLNTKDKQYYRILSHWVLGNAFQWNMNGNIMKNSSVEVIDMPDLGFDKQEGASWSFWYLLLVLENSFPAYFSLDPLRIPGLGLVCAQFCAHGSKDCLKFHTVFLLACCLSACSNSEVKSLHFLKCSISQLNLHQSTE